MEVIRHLREHLEGEHKSARFLIFTGILTAIAASVLFSFFSLPYGKSLLLSALPFSYLQIMRGGIQYFRTARLKESLTGLARNASRTYYEEEKVRTGNLSRQLNFFMAAETGFLILGLVLVLLASLGNLGYSTLGIGIGCLVQSALLLVNDLFASLRLGIYRHFLS